MEEYQLELPIGLTCRSNETDTIHACPRQIAQDVTAPYKRNRVIFCFGFHPAPEELLRSATAVPEGKFPQGLYVS